jgi:hypothetical protein
MPWDPANDIHIFQGSKMQRLTLSNKSQFIPTRLFNGEKFSSSDISYVSTS